MPSVRKPRPSAILRYLHENLDLHRRLNANWNLDDAESLEAELKQHFEHPFQMKTNDALVDGTVVASMHDGFIERVTERRIPGTNHIRTHILASSYFYDNITRMEVGQGTVAFTFEGRTKLRKLASIQGNRIFELVIDVDSKCIGFTLCPSWTRRVIVEFPFETMTIVSCITQHEDERGPDNLNFLEEQTGETA